MSTTRQYFIGQTRIYPGIAFELNGFAHSAAWNDSYNDADRTRFGITYSDVTDPTPTPSVPRIISDRQFFQQMAVLNIISQAEALAAVKVGDIPSSLQTLINTLPSDQQFVAEMLLSGATTFDRQHPMTALLAAGMGWTDAQVDAVWTAAAAL